MIYTSVPHFPNKWSFKKRLLYGIDAVDTNLLLLNNKYYIITCVKDDKLKNKINDRYLAIFFTNDLFSDNWASHPINNELLYCDEKFGTGRGAGFIYEENGSLIRPMQYNPDFYGESIVLNKIELLNENEFIESKWAK